MLRYISPLLVLALITGCIEKDGSYKKSTSRTSDMIEKSALDMDATYLYVPSSGAAPRFAKSQNPFFQGDEKLVQLRFVENGLEVLEIDSDAELDENGMIVQGRYVTESEVGFKNSPVLTIPGKHLDFRCQKDQFKECTNNEEVVPERGTDPDQWKDWKYFDPEYADLEQHEVNTTNWFFEDEDGISLQKTEVVGYEVEDGVINIELEKTFQVTGEIDRIIGYFVDEKPESLSFKARFFYSLVDINKLASANYTPVYYAETEHDTFGYFKTERKLDDVTGSCYKDCKVEYMLNRFNPEKDALEYHLSDTFYKPENKIFLDATREVIAKLNQQLAGADTGLPPVKLVEYADDPSEAPNSGDLRYSMINLVDDPLDNGLLGYGPSVAHPLTGEIVQAHVNQYSGVGRTLSRRVWNDLVRRYNRGDISVAPTVNAAPQAAPQVADNQPKEIPGVQHYDVDLSSAQNSLKESQIVNLNPDIKALEAFNTVHKEIAKTAYSAMQPEDDIHKMMMEHEEKLHHWGEHTAFHEDAIWISSTVKGFLPGLDPQDSDLSENGKLLEWSKLSDEAQKKVSDEVALVVYKTTLVHELGHNFGLRHNFQGSFDKANFYTEAEAAELGLKHIPAYSSVMDYAPSQLDELPVWGKYDLAAFRFAYKREVELQEDKVFSLAGYDQLYSTEVKNADGKNTQDGSLKLPYGVINYLNSYIDLRNQYTTYQEDPVRTGKSRRSGLVKTLDEARASMAEEQRLAALGRRGPELGHATQADVAYAQDIFDKETVKKADAGSSTGSSRDCNRNC